jgi:hypothetical protein
MIVVDDLLTMIFFATPNSDDFMDANFLSVSFNIATPPVIIAMSFNISRLLSPYPGAFIATIFKPFFNLL